MVNGIPKDRRSILGRFSTLFCLLLTVLISGCSAVEEVKKQADVASTLQEADRQFSLGNIVQGEKWCDRAVTLDPDSIATYLGGGDDSVQTRGLVGVLTDHGDYPDIVRYLTVATKNPNLSKNYMLYRFLADAQYHVGNQAGEQEAYRDELTAMKKQFTTAGATIDTGSNSSLIVDRADAEWGAGDTADALKDYHNIIETNPDEAPVAENDQAYYEAVSKQNLPQALDLAKKAVASERHADDDETLGLSIDTLGWVEHQMGDDKDAVSDLEQAASLLPQEGDISFHLACTYQALGRTQDAIIEFQRTIQLQPFNTEAQQALNTLSKKSPSIAAAV